MIMRLNSLLLVVMFVFGSIGLMTTTAFAQNFADIDEPVAEEVEEDLDQIIQAAKTSTAAGPLEEASKYTLGPTDVIEISVMRHPEVSGIYPINKEGKIQYEFVGDLLASGFTKEELTDRIKESLSEYIVSPEVAIKIVEYNSKVVYVVGEVYSPGKIFMQGDTITVREALVLAGLPQLTGITKKSKLITPDDKGKPDQKLVNVYALLYEGDLRENFVMNPGDVLYIPPTFLTKTMRAIQPVTAPISNAGGTARSMRGF